MDLDKRKNLNEDIAAYLTEKIIRMEIMPGERITEAQIAQELNVSHSPVREAFQILQRCRLVELIPRRGARVTEMSAEYIRCLFEVMIELFGFVIRRCCEDRSKEELSRYLELNLKAKDHANNRNVEAYYETLFDTALLGLEVSRNPLLTQMIHDWFPSLRRAYFLAISASEDDLEESLTALHDIMENVQKKNPKKGERAIRSHLNREKERILEIAEQSFKDKSTG